MRRENITRLLSSFFDGEAYLPLVGTLALFSSLVGIEIFGWLLASLLIVVSAIVSDSVRAIASTLVTLPLHVSSLHSPSPTVSGIYGDGNVDYYFSGWRFPLLVLSIIFVIIGLSLFFIKNKCYGRISPWRDVIFIPTVILSVAFLLGGAGTAEYAVGIPLSLLEVVVFGVLYIFFYYGISRERGDMKAYFSYLSATVGMVIVLQLSVLFLTSERIFVSGGINKEGVILGWGIWTVVGNFLAACIPGIFIGTLNSRKHGFSYFSLATLTLIFSVMTMSRSAQLISVLVYLVCIAIVATRRNSKPFYRIYFVLILALGLIFIFLFCSKFSYVVAVFLDDNGRRQHAKIAIENFLLHPFFGVGFSGFEMYEKVPSAYSPMGPLPAMAHSTPLELLSATGAFGFLAYTLYRAASLIPVLKKRTISAVFLIMSASAVLLGGLVDNFPFNIYPMHYATLAIALAGADDKNSLS